MNSTYGNELLTAWKKVNNIEFDAAISPISLQICKKFVGRNDAWPIPFEDLSGYQTLRTIWLPYCTLYTEYEFQCIFVNIDPHAQSYDQIVVERILDHFSNDYRHMREAIDQDGIVHYRENY